ncbi:Putative glycoside hydrolase, family 3, glycoside hydrolase family 3 domain, immunoglobulin [Septoria linicola]|uniref:beta-glucosidase n=1 Tax=Septoria linicola TaxID=215465 RepID=A0A9Q9AYS4_9PEZI|nr:putative glycoside hydrolase, family 3, glycoside hydrolase family 3 domain, immunoglobulin [Septoria linicola]USW57639.1 Putative glycoside hydrolase, family 3, glycoside hydrolase family 3 domain, immunoglobulin [Septoria linicola]
MDSLYEKEVAVTTTNHSREDSPLLPQTHTERTYVWVRKHKWICGIAAMIVLLLPLLALLTLHDKRVHAKWTSEVVYPSPSGYGAGDWSDAYAKAKAMVDKMDLKDMNNVTLGFGNAGTGCVGVSGSANKVDFPGLCLHDAGNGVRNTDGVNAYASGISVGASWNKTLAYERAVFMGAEFKKKGINVALGPVVGPMGRTLTSGRIWEGFASDGFLDGALGAESVRGLQKSVIACIKHLVANEQETNRNPITDDDGTIPSTSANIDDRTMHELYLAPFADAVRAGVGSVMCSYNRINQSYGCENSKIMNGLLKGELNFQGFVVSDWAAQHSSLDSANAGLDMAMPNSEFWDNDKLANARDGFDSQRLVDMATRILATWYQFGQDDPEFPSLGIGMPVDLLKPHDIVDTKDPAAKPSLLQQAIEGHVLVKNSNGTLPLNKPRTLSVFGYDAIAQAHFNPGDGDWTQNREGVDLQQPQEQQIMRNQPMSDAPSKFMGTLIVGGGSGSNVPAYISSPYEALQARAYDDDTSIFYDFTSHDPRVVPGSDACLVFINEYASEAWDRPGLADEESDDLVSSVASQCNNTVVVIHNAGPRLVDDWIENNNITAVVFAHLPGQDAGRAIVSLLYGDVSFSGRLPYTVAKKESDYGNLAGPCVDESRDPQCDFSEGVNIDYRHFLARKATPRYEFGYGLTYSTFEYSGLGIKMNATATADIANTAPIYANFTTNQNSERNDVGIGGLQSLYESVGTIGATITNTGKTSAAEVAQLYLEIPVPNESLGDNPNTRVLRGFEKVDVVPGESAQISFSLRRKDISYWDTFKQAWIVPDGVYQVFVGKSVLDTPLVDTFRLE